MWRHLRYGSLAQSHTQILHQKYPIVILYILIILWTINFGLCEGWEDQLYPAHSVLFKYNLLIVDTSSNIIHASHNCRPTRYEYHRNYKYQNQSKISKIYSELRTRSLGQACPRSGQDQPVLLMSSHELIIVWPKERILLLPTRSWPIRAGYPP